jgi:DNA-binding transcriptional LysR family regulator
MSVNLERLHVFVIAARSATFAAAAKARSVSVSSISQHMRALEREVGHPLFERRGRRVQLTAEGKSLLDTTEPHLTAILQSVTSTGARAKRVEGVVTIGSPRTFGRAWVAPRLGPLIRRHPGLQLHFRFDVPSVLERQLADGQLDLAVLSRPTELPGMTSTVIAQERFVAVGAPALARVAQPTSETETARLPWLLFDQDRPMHDTWWRATFGATAKLKPTLACEAPSLEVLEALALAGAGWVVLPDYLAGQAISEKTLVVLPVAAKREAKNGLHLAWRAGVVATARLDIVRRALT